MASAICTGIIKSNIAVPQHIILFDKNKEQYLKFNSSCKIASDLSLAISEADYIFFSVKPQNLRDLLEKIQVIDINNKIFISICAGIKISSIEKFLPNIKLVRVMPNTPLLIGNGASALCKNDKVQECEFCIVEQIFSSMGITARVNESDMDAITALTGSSPAYVYTFIKAMLNGANELNLNNPNTLSLICQTIIGSVLMVSKGDKSIDEHIRMVKSPNGTTEKALNVLEASGFNDILIEAMRACSERSKELSNLF